MKKVLVALLTFVMVVTGFVCLNPKASEVKAATETELSADGNYVTVAKGKWNEDAKGVPVLDGYLFAGYFKEKDCTLETRTSKAGAKYAKFVKEDVLDVKIQITNGTVKSSYETDKNGDTPYVGKHVIRFVSSVDSLDYKNIGFELEFKDAEGNVQKLSTKTTKTFKRIASTIGADQSGADTYSFSPKMVSEDSLNFFTAKLPVENTAEAMATVYKVRAFWTTLDGTVIRGQERAVSVNDTQENVVNMSVETSLDLSKATVTYGPNAEGTGASGKEVTVLTSENGVVNVRVELADGETKDELKSATKFVFTIGDDTASAVYRNYYTTHAPRTGGGSATPDITWYTVNPEGTVFQIASSADMYGLAKIVNDGLTTFEDKEINVIRDIVLNEGIAKRSDGSTAPTWVKATIGGAEASLCEWTAIGGEWGSSGINTSNPTKFFNGRFDGCGHTISGMRETYYAPGFFGYAGPKAEICNFKLVNSFIDVLSGAAKVSGIVAAGCPKKIENVYTDMVISSKKNFASAFLGQIVNGQNGNDLTEITINNCWFDGEMYLVGTTVDSYSPFVAYASKKYIDLKLTNCLFTGTVNGAYKNYGTFFGHTSYGGTIKITLDNCMSMGNINLAENASACGAVFANANSVVTLNNVYINEANGPQKIYNTNTASTYKANNVQCVNRDTMLSLDSITDKFPLLSGETESPWICDSASNSTDRGTPVLKSFASWWAERYQVKADTSWYDKDNPQTEYPISTAEQLCGLAELSQTYDFANTTFNLTADIEFNKSNPTTVKKWRNGIEVPVNIWTPIGRTKEFAGIFNGHGHTISGLYYNGNEWNIGLIGSTTEGSIIKNVKVVDSYFKTTGADAGGVIGVNKATTIENLYSNAIVDASGGNGGGIVGKQYGHLKGTTDDYFTNVTGTNWTIKNVWFDGEVVSYSGKNYYSGIIGGIPNQIIATIDNALFTGKITGTDGKFVGGIIGGNNNASTININNCLSVGMIQSDAVYESAHGGGIYGYVNSSYTNIYISDSYTTINNFNAVGRTPYNYGKLTTTEGITLKQTRDWLITANEDTILPLKGDEPENAWVSDNTEGWNNTDRGTPILATFADWWTENVEHDELTVDMSWYYEGESPYKLGTAAELRGFAELAKTHNFAGETVKLGASIELNKVNDKILTAWKTGTPAEFNWTPIGTSSCKFAGEFDGQGYTIRGLYYKGTGIDVGLFGFADEGSIFRNVKIVDSYLETSSSSSTFMGALLGEGYVTACENIYTNAILVTDNGSYGGSGGIIGCLWGDGDSAWSAAFGADSYEGLATMVSVRNCWFDGQMLLGDGGTTLYGGIIGHLRAPTRVHFEDCLNTGDILGTAGTGIGGIVGKNTGYSLQYFDNCLTAGSIDSALTAGTIHGGSGSAHTKIYMTNCYSAISGKDVIADRTIYNTNSTLQGTDIANVNVGRFNVINADVSTLFNSTAWANDIGYNAVDRGTPVLKCFKNWWLARQPETELLDRADTSWYTSTEAGEPYVLDTAAELYGFAMLGQTNSFAGQTIKLGADIELNKVDANVLESWKKGTEPFAQWTAVGTSSVPFAGTFDGQNHIISGLYLNTETTKSGMFGTVAYDAEIKNFKLVDSYMTSTQTYLGLIGSGFVKTIENVYSNAYIYAPAGYASGFIADCTGYNMVHDGYTERPMNIKNCWFDGQIDGGDVGLAGFIATKGGSVSAVINISDCLFTGNIKCSVSDAKVRVGTFYGVISRYGYYNFDNCLSVGKVEIAGQDATSAVGFYDGQNLSTVGSYTYVCDGKWIGVQGTQKPGTLGIELTRQEVASQDVSELFKTSTAWVNDNTNGWNDTDRGTPILATFADFWRERQPEPTYTVDLSWYNSGDYTLYDLADLRGFVHIANNVDDFNCKTVKLGADITINEPNVAAWKEGTVAEFNWTPIGNSSKPFAGTFDGNGKTISGLFAKGSSYVGLFGYVGESAEIRNFKLADSYMNNTGSYTGVIAYGAPKIIESVYSNAIIESMQMTGGIIGQWKAPVANLKGEGEEEGVYDGVGTRQYMKKCWFDGTIQLADGQSYSGGLIGRTEKYMLANIEDCLFSGTLTGANATQIGGLYGYDWSTVNLTIKNCLVAGCVDVTNGTYIGALTGRANGNAISQIKATNTYVTSSPICGSAYNSTNVQFPTTVTGREELYLSDIDTLFTGSSAWVKDTGYNDIDRGTPILAEFEHWWLARQDEGNIEVAPSVAWYSEPDEEGAYVIQNKGDLLGFLSLSKQGEKFDGKTIKLGANITLNTPDVDNWKAGTKVPTYQWTPVSFEGNFDGQEHYIKGVYVKSGATYVGFFGQTAAGSTISNFRLLDSYVEQTAGAWSRFTGAIVGDGSGNIDNVYSNATVVSACNYVGGIVGHINPTNNTNGEIKIANCWFAGIIQAADGIGNIGGIVGKQNKGKLFLENVLYTGHIKAKPVNVTNPYIGGILGMSEQGSTGTELNSVVSAGTFDIPGGTTSKIGSVVGYFYSGADSNNTANYVLNNVFANREWGTATSWGGSNGTHTGQVIQTSHADRLIGFIPQTVRDITNNAYQTVDGKQTEVPILIENQKLDFTSVRGWTMRTNDVPVPTVLKDVVDARTIVTDATAATLTNELGLGTISGSLSNAVAGGAGDYLVTVTGSKSNYDGYLSQLASLGFTKYTDNVGTEMETDGIYSATYCKSAIDNVGEWVVNVTFVTNDGKIYVSINSDVDSVAKTLLNDDAKNPLGTETGNNAVALSMVEDHEGYIKNGVLEPLDVTGNCFVFQLPNGHFIINDGNTDAGAGKILKAYLQSQVGEGNPIIIDAWTISHFHNDHAGALMDFASDASLRENVYLNAVYANEPSAYGVTLYEDRTTGDLNSAIQGAKLLTKSPTDSSAPDIYQVHMGQRYYFNGITIDVVNTPEQLPADNWQAEGTGHLPDPFNTSSVNFVFSLSETGKRVLLGGDSTKITMQYMIDAYGANNNTLANINVFAAYHHGKNVMNDYSFSRKSDGYVSAGKGTNEWADFLLKNSKNGSNYKFDVMLFPNDEVMDAVTKASYLDYRNVWVADDGSVVYPSNISELNKYYYDNANLHFTTGFEDITSATEENAHGTVKITFNANDAISWVAYNSLHGQEVYTITEFTKSE